MAESVVSVCWKDHISELTTVYKSLVGNNFLVDCTISAEGQCLKAHRLILSASSPYFHMLFSEETGEHPCIFLIDESFETLRAVIDFVYRGETHIREGNLKAFLALARSLQIKGLNAFTEDYNKTLSSNPTYDISQGPSEDNQVTCGVESVSASQGKCSGSYSQQHPHLQDGYPAAEHTNSSIPFEGYSASCEEVRTPQKRQRPGPLGCDEVSIETEITLKHEPLYAVFSETRKETLDKSENDVSVNSMSEIRAGTESVFGIQDLNQYSSGCVPSHGNGESSVMPPSQGQFTQSNNLISSGQDVAEEVEPLVPSNFVSKSEHIGHEETVDGLEEPGSATREEDEGTEPTCGEQNPHPFLSVGGPPSEQVEATRSGGGQLSEASASPSGLHEDSRARKPLLRCGECPATFTSSLGLKYHKRLHTGERPHVCDMCGKTFVQPSSLIDHKRTHTGERLYGCDVCGRDFTSTGNLASHKRIHTGERPYRCELCGNTFSRSQHLVDHKRTHSGERPYCCDVCGAAFVHKSSVVIHMRTHTGERPYHCDVCGKDFAQHSSLVTHKRRHTGERPYRCDVCGKSFIKASNLSQHKRTHTENRHKANTLHFDECNVTIVTQDIVFPNLQHS